MSADELASSQEALSLPPAGRMAGFRTLKPLRTRGPAREWLAVREGERGFRRLCSLRFAHADDPAASDSLVREAACMARLHHPTILPVFDFLSVDNGHVLVLAFEGVFSLERVTSAMRRQPVRFEMQAALFVAHALFDALAHAHHKFDADGFPITHGDVHPSHLILCKDGHALVRGFCGVHPHGARDDADPYAAPELEAGRPASPTSDLYGAAAIAWELLAGRGLPKNGPPPPVAAACPGAPAEVAAVLDTCLSADPALRCIRAGTVAATLRRAADLHEGQECLKRLHARVLRRLPASVRAVSSGTLPPRTPHDASSPTRRFLRHRPRTQVLVVGHPGHPLRCGSRPPDRDDLMSSVIPAALSSLPSIPDTSLVDVDASREAIDDDSPTLRTDRSGPAWDEGEVPGPDDDTLVQARAGSRTPEPWGMIESTRKPLAADPFAPTEPFLQRPVPLQPLSFPPVAADPDESFAPAPRVARNVAIAVAISLLLAPAAWFLGRHGVAHMRASEPQISVASPELPTAVAPPLATEVVSIPRVIEPVPAPVPVAAASSAIPLYQTRLIVDGPPDGVVYVNGVVAGKTGEPWLTRGCGLRFVRVGTEKAAHGVTWLSKGQTERLPCGATLRIRVRR